MTRRISSSRPMTGSSVPARASVSQVAAVLLEGRICALGVRRRDALAATNALQRAEDGLLAGTVALQQGLGVAAHLGRADEQVLGRDVVVAEASGLVLGALDDALRARVQGERAAVDPGATGEDGGEFAAERRQVHAEPTKRLSRDPVIGRDERIEQVLGVQDRAVQSLGGGLGGDDGLLGLLGESVELHSVVSRFGRISAGMGWSISANAPLRRGPRPRRTGRSAGRRFALANRSPGPVPLKRGMPRPVSRNVRPFWVPAGILSRPLGPSGSRRGLRRPSRASLRVSGQVTIEVRTTSHDSARPAGASRRRTGRRRPGPGR